MNTGIPRLIFLLSIAFLSPACTDFFKKDIKEGVIEFKAEALNDAPAMMVPDKLIVKFKDDFFTAELEAGFGLAKMKFISDPGKKEFKSQVTFMDKKQSVMNFDEVQKTNYYLPDYEVEYGKEVKTIAGYSCKNATLKFKDGSPSYDIWFTKDIDIKNPNWSNAYYKVDGVLMDYRLKKFGLELHFTAVSVSSATIDDGYFQIPAEFAQVKNSELEKLFGGFFSINEPKKKLRLF